jgi:hypothetical protein
LKRQTICFVTLGFLLGLGTVGCTEHNPAFHKPVESGVGPSADAAVDAPVTADRPADTWVAPKDAEPRSDIPVLRDTRFDDSRPVDSEGEAGIELPDARALDGHAETGSQDTNPAKDADLDTLIPDTAVVTSPDVPPASPDVEQPDAPMLVQDTANTPPEIDAPEADSSPSVDVLPDAEELDTWPEAEDAEPDSL